ncbi:DUF1948 domain-containing protein [Mycoplasmoides pneumoniae]|uniref:Uncharacterized protein MG027 homolog n=2 Tax=Mycoplasmoides pneumoniae TaxID=2104 RepID=Y030_MYCPN|nr:DUF1948 domain-containing protein [Mycoplasmoides pneumoniae]P75084.1 RecName: Full=Uncharacterized protein MG027 homolog [Mycoplasmoides pneumoniae M129]AAB95772.1 conserved hypothetical protein [Mycoplasmoides pneumoniae M129]ARI11374.1 hypothetical protein B7R95_00165 [Mycoplasmoides pneumoniae]ARI12085.1 hypothetical protein B7R97_00165 [Mycoplasmoides pneumoniae]ARI12793.1 hypothetical protein B7R98_00165 [Mycoplasmoides pneumoniae]ARI13495.1 hypothetical protein B7R99_00165 [Mycoplas
MCPSSFVLVIRLWFPPLTGAIVNGTTSKLTRTQRRIAIVEFIFATLFFLPKTADQIQAAFLDYDVPERPLNDWQKEIVKVFSERCVEFIELIENQQQRNQAEVQSKYNKVSGKKVDLLTKAVILCALSEQHAQATDKPLLISEALLIMDHYSQVPEKKQTHALLDKLL